MAANPPREVSPATASPTADQRLEGLAELVRDDVPPARFFAEFLQTASELARAESVRLWLVSPDQSFRIAAEHPTGDSAQPANADPNSLAEVARSGQAMVRAGPDTTGDARPRLLCPVIHNQQTLAICESIAPEGSSRAWLEKEALPWLLVLGDLAGDYLAWQELRHLRAASRQSAAWDQWSCDLQESRDWLSVAEVIAQDGRVLLDADRVAVLRRKNLGWQVLSVSGVTEPDRQAPLLAQLERFAAAMSKARATSFDSDLTSTQALHDAWDEYCRQSGAIRLLAAICPEIGESSGSLLVTAEWLSSPVPDEVAARWARLTRHVSLTSLRLRGRRSRVTRVVGRWRPWAMATVGIAAIVAIAMLPVELNVVAHGSLVPVTQQDLFAPRDGVVVETRVEHGDRVVIGQPILRLRDPALQLELARVTGELQTVQSRIDSVQASRVTNPLTGTDGVNRARLLAAEEEELRERQNSLARQLELLRAEEQELEVLAPIAGEVLTWDVGRRLDARTVSRGQVLLTIGRVDGDWMADLRVRDRDIGHVLSADPETMSISFVRTADPGRPVSARLRRVSDVIETGPEGPALSLEADFQNSDFQPTAGARVIGRISCGRTTLAYAWLRDLIESVRLWGWSWLG
ncbi:MAG: efflux RND transporter periplasmic adaptor subunit [Planctomycetaceae bacterium]|nr:efflux RND transporter periplasmic adaptor subunit [Planctomycetaceae bacterium]